MPDLGQWTYKVHKSEEEELWSVSVAYNISFQSKLVTVLPTLFFYWVEITYFFFYLFLFLEKCKFTLLT